MFVGFLVTLVIRCLGGEALLSWRAAVAFPWYDAATNTQYFPFKTMSMLLGLLVMLIVAYITDGLMKSGRMSAKALMVINNRYGREERLPKLNSQSDFNSNIELKSNETKFSD